MTNDLVENESNMKLDLIAALSSRLTFSFKTVSDSLSNCMLKGLISLAENHKVY